VLPQVSISPRWKGALRCLKSGTVAAIEMRVAELDRSQRCLKAARCETCGRGKVEIIFRRV